MIDALRDRYAAPEWAVFTEVRSALGARVEGLRIADAIAVALWPSRGWEAHGFELKRSRGDFLRELDDPAKSITMRAFCTAWWLVVPAPWKRIVLSVREVPEGWGLLEVTGHDAEAIVEAPAVPANEPPLAFVLSLLRAASGPVAGSATSGAPLVAINRPRLARDRVGLACGHVAPRPLDKVLPTKLPCFDCVSGSPTDLEVVLGAIDDASPEALDAIGQALARRTRRSVA